jgi:hypothetical protein
MSGPFDDAGVRARLASTAEMMEAFAVLAFSRAAQNLGDAAPGEAAGGSSLVGSSS